LSLRISSRAASFGESIIRQMTRVARETGAVNLAQGFPDFPAPEMLKRAACAAIEADQNQYAITWGVTRLREAIAEKYGRLYDMPVDPDRDVIVTCGATEAMAAVFLAAFDPDDEVLVPEPYYENYGPDAVLAHARPVHVALQGPDYHLDASLFEQRITERTRAIVLNSPNNPTGRVFTREELSGIAALCLKHDLIAITDEIYEHILYDGEHIPLATLPGMRERTITVSGASKTFAVTGWRIGTIVAPPPFAAAIRSVHDFLTVGAPAPLQEAIAVAMEELPEQYYTDMRDSYLARRELLVPQLQAAGFACQAPEGAYYVLADISAWARPDEDDQAFARRLSVEAGVTPVPGSSFFTDPADARRVVRFAFCKQKSTLEEAAERLHTFARAGVS
jgi:aminotransferase